MAPIAARLALAGLLVAGGLALAGPAPQTGDDTAAEHEQYEPLDPIDLLLEQIDALNETVEALRQELAQSRLETAEARSELDELRVFIDDHHEFGRDFEQYRAVKAAAERDARARRAEAAKAEREAAQERRTEQQRLAAAERAEQQAAQERIQRYRDAGFAGIGHNVFAGQMAFYYGADAGMPARIDWDPRTGNFLRLYPYLSGTVIDYSTMTISGSILNATEETRNIGVAITFFDELGNQVGGEIVQVNNARPDVPYPFTATISMALNRPFASSSTHVLYADPAAE